MTLDIDTIRSHFPAFSEPALKGQTFFDSAAGSYACGFVIDRLERFYRERKVQPYEPHKASQLAGAEMDEARQRLAEMMGVETDEVSFGPSTTQNTYVLAQAFREWLKPGDAIVVSNQDHEANAGVWRKLEKHGVEVREWQLDPDTGHLDPERLKPLLKGAKLLCFPHCSNVVAEINDVAAITQLAHDEGVYVCVDGVSYAPHGIPDVGALGPDIYLFSSYKTYGPHQGIMVIRRELGETLPNQAHYFNGDTLYKRFTPAGPDHAQVAACAGMADYCDALYASLGLPETDARGRSNAVHDAMRAREMSLLQPLLDYVASRNTLRVIGPTDATRRAPTVAVVADRSGAELATELARQGIMCSGGDFYAVRPLEAMGVDLNHGALRLSFTHYTTEGEVEQLIKALHTVL